VLLDLRVSSLGIGFLDRYWQLAPWPAMVLAAFAVAGLPHAFNLIDGYNGLAGAVAVICCLALAYVALQVGDRELAGVVLVLAGATRLSAVELPTRPPFCGDGGAYLWGVVIAVAALLWCSGTIGSHPGFLMLLLAYPVLETAFSVYRKVCGGSRPALPTPAHPPADLPAHRA
jgi:UDP-GlcNAc:undecaprenyl-phosphate GlcNAc-1-phosphate transferase